MGVVEQRGAGHAGASVDEHGAGAADLFETRRIVSDRRGLLAVARDRVGRDLHQRRSDVHVRLVRNLKLFPRRLGLGGELAFDFKDYGLVVCHLAFSLYFPKTRRPGRIRPGTASAARQPYWSHIRRGASLRWADECVRPYVGIANSV